MLIYFEKTQPDGACNFLLGGFDGLHKGHVTLLNAAKARGGAIGLLTITGFKGGDLFTAQERGVCFSSQGITFADAWEFSALKEMTAEDFVRYITKTLPKARFFCGEDFRFGKGAAGTAELFSLLSHRPVEVLPAYGENGEKISTSRIKELLAAGEMPRVNALLAHSYMIQGEVRHGREVGRTMDFPTLNVEAAKNKLLPKEGVYGGCVETQEGSYPAIINVGSRPTFGLQERVVEAHLLDFHGDLYGTKVCVYPQTWFRPIRAFSDKQALAAQLKADIARRKESL